MLATLEAINKVRDAERKKHALPRSILRRIRVITYMYILKIFEPSQV